eukprot:jgi/Chrzof1/1283/Cz10g01050.t1
MALAAVAIGWRGIVVIITIGISLIVMAFDAVPPDFVFGLMASIFMVTGIINLKEGSSGFSNTGVLTVVVLYAVAEGVSQTGGLDIAMNYMLGKARTVFWAQVRMMIPVMFASAFLNNTPIVALLIPILLSWARRCNISPKKLLIPLSFATVLGGTCTIIGTSTNLVVSGLQQEKYGKTRPDLVFGFFDITPFGVPYAVWGAAYILLFSQWLLPGDSNDGSRSDLMFGLFVPPGATAVGKTVKEAGLLQAAGANLVSVMHKGHVSSSISPQYVIHAQDTLYLQGGVRVAEQIARDNGLVLTSDETESFHQDAESAFNISASEEVTTLLQVNVLKSSELVGKTIKEAGFRGRFNAAVIAVKRSNLVQEGGLGSLVLQANDVLVLSTGDSFNVNNKDFTGNFNKLVYLDEALAREFTTAMRVSKGAKIIGKSINEAGLRGVTGLYLFEIERADGTRLKAVTPDTLLEAGDLLWFAGDLDGVAFLMKVTGLEHMQSNQVSKLKTDIIHRRLVQAVVSSHGHLIGKTLKEARFRDTYGAAVIAVHRSGSGLPDDISSIALHAGDVLVLETGPDFESRFQNNKAFALISEVPGSSPVKRSRMWVALFLVTAMVTTQVIGGAMDNEFIHLWVAAMLVVALMLATKCMSVDQARNSIDWSVYICIAFAFGVGTAMEKSNVARAIAEVFAAMSRRIGGETAALSCMYLVTAILSEILTNNAAAALMYPVASTVADELGIHPNLMSVAVMLGGSAGWVLPYSYQCNLMVYAAGKYKTMDFVKIGFLYHFWLFIGVIVILGNQSRWWIAVVASMAFLALVITLPAIWEYALNDKQRKSIEAQFGTLWSKLLPKSASKNSSRAIALNGADSNAHMLESKDIDKL